MNGVINDSGDDEEVFHHEEFSVECGNPQGAQRLYYRCGDY